MRHMTDEPIREMLVGLRHMGIGVPYGFVGILCIYVEREAAERGMLMSDVERWIGAHEEACIVGRGDSETYLRSGGGATYDGADPYYLIPRYALGLTP
jgi:hypothetical protein